MEKHLGYKPTFLKRESIKKFLKQNINVVYVDAFEHQLKELFIIKNYKYIGLEKKEVYSSREFKDFCAKYKNKYKLVYYPWNNHLVKVITKDEYLALKTNRNQDMMTKEEQENLRNMKVAVFGMSVGSNIAFILTQAGISNEITIADFDNLDTTNLNRILAGVHQIGLNKTIIAARRIYEDNPYAKVNILPKGINEKNLSKLLKNKKLDCIIEEIDDIKMKISTRIIAKKYKVPVIMITDNGDGVVLHVERYDLGYKKIFNKDLSYWKKLLSRPMTREVAGGVIVNNIVGGIQKVDKKMFKSLKKVFEKKLVSWPQLGSAAILGGVIATYALKQLSKNKKKYLTKNYDLSL